MVYGSRFLSFFLLVYVLVIFLKKYYFYIIYYYLDKVFIWLWKFVVIGCLIKFNLIIWIVVEVKC